ncbi:unnamed protein product [Rotaria magnacalcarata]|uniref:Uncharacterized protein n=3 Tax=Rotaria magnacalcarata TaxID=392030 RepID=A0A816C8T0_9BILA|nr:unnamed protein product [Rotaria magnacalcarata]
MATSPSSSKKILGLEANATAPRGATIRLTVEYRICPPASTKSGPTYEDVSMRKTVDVNMGTEGQYKQEATYQYGNETDLSIRKPYIEPTTVIVRPPVISSPPKPPVLNDDSNLSETVTEHISEDEKSTSSEEAFFEEWSEEFRCRRRDEYDENTQRIIRTDIIETGDRVRSDVVKEEYKGKNVRIKGHKSYDIVKKITRTPSTNKIVPINQVQTHIHEEITQPPPSFQLETTMSSLLPKQDQPWASEDIYTTEIVCDSNLAREIESRTPQQFDLPPPPSSSSNYDRVRSGRYSPIPSTNQAIISTTPSSQYERISTVQTPTSNYADTRKQEPEEFFSEEYEVEVQTTKHPETSEEDTMDTNTTANQTDSSRRGSDWRTRLRQIYAPPSDDDRFDQYNYYNHGRYNTQRASVMPSYTQSRDKGIPVPDRDRVRIESRRFDSSPPPRHVFEEVLITGPRYSPSERKYRHSSGNDDEQKKKKVYFADSENREKVISSSSIDDDDHRQSSRNSSSTLVDAKQTQQYPTFGHVGELKTTFEVTTNTGYIKEDNNTSKYQIPITTGVTEQRRRVFEERQQTVTDSARRPINEFQSNERHMSETHAAPSLVTDRIANSDNLESKAIIRIKSNERLSQLDDDSLAQTTVDIQIKHKQGINSDVKRPTQPIIYQTTSKSTNQKHTDDAGDESEDELSDPKQNYDVRRRISKGRLRDFSQSTTQPIDTNLTAQRTTTKFTERNMENILSHVPTSKGKGILVELSSDLCPSPTRSIHEQNKSSTANDSGVYEYSTTTSQKIPTSSPTWRHNVSTSITDDGTRTYDRGVYVDSTATSTSSPFTRRQTSDADQTTLQNVDDSSLSRSTYKYNTEASSSEPINVYHQQRTVRRQLRSSTPDRYENLSSYRSGIDIQSKVPITTQSPSRKPLIVDEIETIETETHVECQIKRTNEIKESTKTERTTSPSSPPKKLSTILTRSTYSSSDETTPNKRGSLNERPKYDEKIITKDSSIREAAPIQIQETCFKPIERYRSPESLHQSPSQNSINQTRSIEVTSLSPQDQVTFGKNSPNEIIAIVRVPELENMRHGISEPELNKNIKQDHGRSRLQYQRVHATSYLPPSISENYRQQPNRSLVASLAPVGTKHDYSSPLNFSTRSASYHSSFHEQNQPQQQQQSYSPTTKSTSNPQIRCHSGSLGNLLGSNLDFEIEIEKRPLQQPEQPTIVSLDQSSRAIVTTSKDGRVSIQNFVARPGNTVTINSDFHASDRSLNRSSGYFSSDELRCQGVNANYSSDDQSNSYPQQSYNFDQVNQIVDNYSRSPNNNPRGFDETIDQIDALYNNLDVQTNNQTYKFSTPISTRNRRKELSKNSNEYSTRYTSTGFQHIPYEQQPISNIDNNNNNNNNSSSSILVDYVTPNSGYGSTQNVIVYRNRFNDQSQIVQRNRTSIKQMKQKNAARKRNVLSQGHYSDEEDNNYDSPISDHGNLEQRSRVYNFNHYHQ